MNERSNQLVAECEKVGDAITEGLRWVQDNHELFGNTINQTLKDFKKAIVAARKLRRASMRKMCVGVFGISQAGKSYLISALAQKDGLPLTARFPGEDVDFLAKINPEGGKESTGIVTRFTIDKISDIPDGYPIFIRLLSEIDVVKILVNSFVFDISHDDDGVEGGSENDKNIAQEVFDLLRDLEQRKSGSPSGQITEEDIYELEEYCGKPVIRSNRNIKKLRNMAFWDEVVKLLPYLGASERGRIYALLWKNYEVLTAIFNDLQSTLNELDYESEIFCSLDGLFYRDENNELQRIKRHSIVDVSTLNLFNDPAGATDTVAVRGKKGGLEKQISRRALTALISEMVVVMRDQPYDFFEYTDLLDFPGARERTPVNIEPSDPEYDQRKELILRGKVAYLFDRYSADQELTSLLLCAGPENNDAVQHIDGLVNDWIVRTHGETPSDRDIHNNALFFVLTKFDTAFTQSVGKDNPFPARIDNSLVQPYSKRYDWLMSWTQSAVFNNCYAIRNPKIRQDSLFDYAENDDESSPLYYQEINIRSEKSGYIDKMKQDFLASDGVNKYFKAPDMAWNALMGLNDGGISCLIGNLRPLCNPELKQVQVSKRIVSLSRHVADTLGVHYVSGDIEEEQAKKRAISMQTARSVASCATNKHFARFIESLQVRENDVYDLCLATKSRPFTSSDASNDSTAASNSADQIVSKSEQELMDELGSFFSEPSSSVIEAENNQIESEKLSAPTINDFATHFSVALEQHWAERMRELARDDSLLRQLALQADAATVLAEEIIFAAKRLDIFSTIAQTVRQFEQFKEDTSIWKQVETSINYVNEYVAYLGCGGVLNEEGVNITSLDGKQQRVFKRPDEIDGYPAIGEQAHPIEKDYYMSWIMSFIHMTDENVRYLLGMGENLEENARLGSILDSLKIESI